MAGLLNDHCITESITQTVTLIMALGPQTGLQFKSIASCHRAKPDREWSIDPVNSNGVSPVWERYTRIRKYRVCI